MNKRFSIALLSWLMVMQVGANPINRSEARAIAQEFIGVNDNADDNVPIAPYYVFSRGEGKGYVPQTVPLSVVFLAKCSDCGAQIRVASAPETRLRMLCNSCAAKAFPETFYGKTAQV